MLTRLTKLIGRYPKITLVVILALTILLSFGISKIKLREFGRILPENDPRIKAYDEVDETFGGAELVMAAITFNNVFTTENLKTIDELTKGLEKVKGVTRVISIANIEEIKGVEEGIEVRNLIEKIPDSKVELQKLKTKILSDENYVGNIISKDGKSIVILAQTRSNIDKEKLAFDIKETVNKTVQDKEVYLIGEAIFTNYMTSIVKEDMGKLIPIAIFVVALILYLSFKNFRGIILPVSIVIITVIWMTGLMGFIGIQFSMVSTMLPVIIIAIGIADAIHILTRYREETLAGFNKKEAITRTIAAVGLACFLTSITTMVGFSSLCLTSLSPIKEFGMSVTIGVGIAFIITVTFLSAILFLIPPFKKEVQIGKKPSGLSLILNKSSNFIVERPRIVFFVTGVLIILAIIGISKISTDTNEINFFKKNSPIRKTYEIITKKFSGKDTIQVVVEGDITDTEVLIQMEEFQNKLQDIKILGKPVSIVNVLKDVNKALHEDDPEYEVLPLTKEGVAQYLLLLSMGGSEHLDKLITFDYTQALIQARVGSYSQQELSRIIEKVEKIMKETFSDVNVTLTGSVAIEKVMLELLWKGQVQSLVFAIVAVFIMMVIVSRSFIYGLFCTVPVALTVLLNFGVMGWFDIPFDVSTAMMASVSIGIGVDYAIHFFSRFKEEKIKGKVTSNALKISITNTGTAILYNAFAVGIGFFVLIFCSMPPLGLFGLLIALTMLFSSTISLTVLPALLFLRDGRKEKRIEFCTKD